MRCTYSSGRYQITSNHFKSEECITTKTNLQLGIKWRIWWKFPAEAQKTLQIRLSQTNSGLVLSQRGIRLYNSSKSTKNVSKAYPNYTAVNSHASRTLSPIHCCLTLMSWPRTGLITTYHDYEVPPKCHWWLSTWPDLLVAPRNRSPMTNPEATLHASQDTSFESVRTDAHGHIPISPWEVALDK